MPGLTEQYLSAAATATANLDALADAATNANDVEKTSYYAQAVVRTGRAPQCST